MIMLEDLLDTDELDVLIALGRVTERFHDTLPLKIYNYTNQAQYANEWTNEERVCRGLIVTAWNEVISRGMPKFFNYGDPHGPDFWPTDVGALVRKEDGSLGVGYTYAGTTAIATRGSFHSTQANMANAQLTQDDIDLIHMAADTSDTAIFEIIHPDNRIVLEYGDRQENIHLGFVNNETGETDLRWTEGVTIAAVQTLIAKPIPDDEEGYVVSVKGKGLFKLKGETYLNLHKLMFGLTEKAVWEMLQSHNVSDREAYVNQFPVITQQWVKRKMQYFTMKHAAYVSDTNFVRQYMHDAIPGASRKEQALWLKDNYPDALGRVFAQLDGGNEKLYPLIWKTIKPAHRPYKKED